MTRCFSMVAGAVAFAILPFNGAVADLWPAKLVRIVVPFSAGSAADIVPRIVFEQVQLQTGQTFLIENRPGGGFAPGVGAVKNAAPDGYTILVHSNAFVTAPAVQAPQWDPIKDFSGITKLADVPTVLVISPQKGIETVQKLVARAKVEPGTLNYGTAGIGTPTFLTMERFRLAAGFTGQTVPFKGATEPLTEVVAGRVDVYFSPIAPALSLIQGGQLRPLAIGGRKRASALPDIPTTTEAGFQDADFEFYVGAYVRKGTPPAIIDRIYQEVEKALKDPAVKEKLGKVGAEADPMPPNVFSQRTADEVKLTKDLVEKAGLSRN